VPAKRLERGRFIWPSAADGTVTLTPAQRGYSLKGIWRMPGRPGRRCLSSEAQARIAADAAARQIVAPSRNVDIIIEVFARAR
jgi:transposase